MKSESIERREVKMEEPMIISNPKIMVGKPVIKGTRITVELILDKLAAGQTVEQILEDYPHLTREGIRAALEFAAKSVSLERVYPIEQNRASA
jgi:uncharacterized protein (DUF433 family)